MALALGLLGLALLVWGLALVYLPLAPIVAGALILRAAVSLDRPKRPAAK